MVQGYLSGNFGKSKFYWSLRVYSVRSSQQALIDSDITTSLINEISPQVCHFLFAIAHQSGALCDGCNDLSTKYTQRGQFRLSEFSQRFLSGLASMPVNSSTNPIFLKSRFDRNPPEIHQKSWHEIYFCKIWRSSKSDQIIQNVRK